MARPNDWLCKAEEDLLAAKSLLRDEILGPALYHTQQCAEKALKAYLALKKQKIKRTHDLLILVTDCTFFDLQFNDLISCATELNPYVSATRYPDDCLFIPDIFTVLAEMVLNFIKERT